MVCGDCSGLPCRSSSPERSSQAKPDTGGLGIRGQCNKFITVGASCCAATISMATQAAMGGPALSALPGPLSPNPRALMVRRFLAMGRELQYRRELQARSRCHRQRQWGTRHINASH